MKPRPDQTLSLNMKLLSHHDIRCAASVKPPSG